METWVTAQTEQRASVCKKKKLKKKKTKRRTVNMCSNPEFTHSVMGWYESAAEEQEICKTVKEIGKTQVSVNWLSNI